MNYILDSKKSEKELEIDLGDYYCNTMNHHMKTKNTTNSVFPTNGLWKDDVIYKSTNSTMCSINNFDKYYDDSYHFKKDFEKKYAEEMFKAKNIEKQRKLNEAKK
jgi:hypothetical protein